MRRGPDYAPLRAAARRHGQHAPLSRTALTHRLQASRPCAAPIGSSASLPEPTAPPMTTAPTARLRPLLASAFLVVAATSGLLSACYRDDSTAPGSRRPLSRVLLTDSPFPYDSVTAVEIYIESIAASEKSDTTGMVEADWVTVATPRR